jgi:hypothetical protein
MTLAAMPIGWAEMSTLSFFVLSYPFSPRWSQGTDDTPQHCRPLCIQAERWGWYNVRAIECGDWLPSLRVARKLAEVLKVDPMDVDEFKAAIEKAAKRR